MTRYHNDEERNQARKEQQKRWREANKERLREYQKAYHQDPEVKKRYAEHQRNWRKTNPERYKEIDRKSYAETRSKNRQSRLLSAAKERAKVHNLPFNIDHSDIIIPTHCPVLGIELKAGNNNTRPELDRVKPELGYVKGNVQVISGRANRIKWNATLEELAAIYNYVKQKESN